MIRRIHVALFILLATLSIGVLGDGTAVGIVLNGQPVAVNSATGMPYIDSSSRVMVPLRVVLEKAGAHVTYDNANRLAIVTTESKEILVPIDRGFVVVNGTNRPNDAPARIVNGRTYLPIRIVMEALGYTVSWDSAGNRVVIVSGADTETPVPPVVTEAPVVEAVPNTVGNSSSNLYNGGLITRENQWLYYINFDDGERLWRVDLTTGKANAVSERRAASVNVVDGWAYYRQQASYGVWELYRTKGDGTGNELVVTYNIEWLKVEGDTIYYYQSSPAGLFSRKVKEGYSTKVLDGKMIGISMEDGYFYYALEDEDASNSAVKTYDIIRYKMSNMMNSKIRRIKTAEEQPLAIVIGGRLLYTDYENAGQLYSMSVDGGISQQLTSQKAYNVGGSGTTYYTVFPSTNNALHRVFADGSPMVRLGDDWVASYYFNPSIHLIGDYVFYLDRRGTSTNKWVKVNPLTKVTKVVEKPEDMMLKDR